MPSARVECTISNLVRVPHQESISIAHCLPTAGPSASARGHNTCDAGPFSVSHAPVDGDLPLPIKFDQSLCWKHLDGIVCTQRCCGLDPDHRQDSTSTGMRGHNVAMRLGSSREVDSEAISNEQIAVHNTGSSEATMLTVHQLRLTITGHRWMARSDVGAFWEEAGDMTATAATDIAALALLDTLTRWLPQWQGDILEVHTNDACVMRGVLGEYSGAWHAVRVLCAQYDVELRERLVEQLGFSAWLRDQHSGGSCARALRSPDAVDATVKLLTALGRRGDTGYGKMISHLTV
ncbi:hypothetical protein BC826DRAFT_485751 [Russula brevipes]|nr:hypothetical protein BC826DRAFT_485751 [Russula brevipes]